MLTAVLRGRRVNAEDYGPTNPPQAKGLVCPVCFKAVFCRPRVKNPPSGWHFAHLVAKGTCVNPDGVRKQRIAGAGASSSSKKRLVFAPRSRRRVTSRPVLAQGPGVAMSTRSGATGVRSGSTLIRNAADAARQQAYVEADKTGALDEVTIAFRERTYPWTSFYFPVGTYLDIVALYRLGALPPFIAVEVRRDIHPDPRLYYKADEIPCRAAEDRREGLRVTPVVKNRLGVVADRFDERCVVIAETVVRIQPGERGWSFATVLLTLNDTDSIAAR
jgi:hypothetical protein